jgi:cell fate regulator YaaT (PSP1 superfamily)
MEPAPGQKQFDVVEVRFKNSRKEYFRNHEGIPLVSGEVIAVEGSPGHDIGTVSLVGELVKAQLQRKNIKADDPTLKKVYRKAKQADVDKWKEAQSMEQTTMMGSRKIALDLGLQMKISDVEYQGDKTKAIFYYTADERVDFRELIKKLAEQYRIRVEMRQIGARQEASRLGGIGSCGRELCCSTWLTDFRSVTTGAARYQQLSLNPLKLAGQCGKLKCCLNYELDSYLDAIKEFPQAVDIETIRGKARHQKTDIFKGLMFYSFADEPDQFIPLTTARVKEIIEMNKRGEKPEEIGAVKAKKEIEEKQPDFENVVGQDSLTRFDKQKGQRGGQNRNKKRGERRGEGGGRKPEGGNQPQGQNRGPQNQNRPPQNKPGQQNRPPQNKPGQQNRPPQNKPGQPNRGPQQGNKNQNPNQRNPNRTPNRNPNPNQNRKGPPPPAPPHNTPPPSV